MLAAAFSAVSMAQESGIRLNQVGFAPDAEKTATIESTEGAKPVPVTVVTREKGKKVWKGVAQRTATSTISGKVLCSISPFLRCNTIRRASSRYGAGYCAISSSGKL